MSAAILPLLIPALAGALVLLLPAPARRPVALAAVAAALAAGIWLLVGGERSVVRLGDWPAPFGIVLVADRLSALMVTLAGVGVLAGLALARGPGMAALALFQLLGLNGAFLTGDVFNLFVFFEVMLIASYGLMVQGGALRPAFGYVVANLAASALFLVALGTIYGAVGTLNMADLAARAAVLPVEDAALLRVGVALLFTVFAFKAALWPMQAWLPAAYAAVPGAVAVILTLLSKVGVYALLRMGALLAPSGLMEGVALWIGLAGGATMVLGALGVAGASGGARLAAFALMSSTGLALLPLAVGTQAAVAAVLVYLPVATVAAALLFLVAEAGRGRWLYLVAALTLAGLPPLPGFGAKILILSASAGHPLIWAAILGASFLLILGLARAGAAVAPGRAGAVPVALALALGLATVLSGPMAGWAAATAADLAHPAAYLRAVLP